MNKKVFTIIAIILLSSSSNVFSQVLIPDFTDFDQIEPEYNNILLGNCNTSSLYLYGCHVTCAAMLLKVNGLDVNPVIVNSWLKNTLNECTFNSWEIDDYPDASLTWVRSMAYNADTIKAEIDAGNPVLVRVNNDTHFVIVKGYNNDGSLKSHFIVSDPASRYDRNLSYYSSITNIRIFHNVLRRKASDGLEKYAGSIQHPKSFSLYFKLLGISYPFNVTGFTIGNVTFPDNIITNETSLGNNRYSFEVNLASYSSLINNFKNKSYNLKFSVSYGGDNFPFYGANQIYFVNPDSLTDIKLNDWFKPYVFAGINLGFFKGKPNNTFSPNENLSRAQMAKVIVLTALQLGADSIDISTTNGAFEDVLPSDWFFPYVQTLRNWHVIDPNLNFYPNNSITAGQFAKLLCKGFGIETSDINSSTLSNGNGISGSKINHTATDQSLQTYLDRINEIVVINTINGTNEVERLSAGLIPVSMLNISSSNEILADGSNVVDRSLMSKIIVNAFLYKSSVYKSTSALSNYTIIGDKFELTPNTSGNQPVSISGNISMTSGETRDIGTSSDYQNGSPLYFYWSVDGGTMVSLYPNHRKVRFTAPIVSSVTDYNMYFLSGTAEGKVNEAFITINVSPNGNTSPTVQSSNIYFNGIGYTDINVNWQKGNGQHCLVTCTPEGFSVAAPVNGEKYNGVSNYATAEILGSNSRIVYTGDNNSVSVSGLSTQSGYRFDVYEYNGSVPPNVNYLITNNPNGICHTLQPPITTANFTADPNPLVAGSPCTFRSIGSSFSNSDWVFNGANISTSQELELFDVVYSTPGTYDVTLTNSYPEFGTSATITKQVTVVSPQTSNPDFEVTNFSCTPTILMAGNTMEISYTISNIGVKTSQPAHFHIFVCDNDTLNSSKETMGSFILPSLAPNQSISNTFISPATQNTWSGDMFLIATVDYAGFDGGWVSEIDESDEGNNQAIIPITFTDFLPDFYLTNVSVGGATQQSGGTFNLNYTINGIQSFADPLLGGICWTTVLINTVPTLNGAIRATSGGYSSHSTNGNYSEPIKFSSLMPSGNYYLLVVADEMNMVNESNENNNFVAIPITLSNPSQPTISSSNINLSNITQNTATISWTSGNGQGRIVIATPGQIPPLPKDGTDYNFNTDFILSTGTIISNGITSKIVYKGTGNSVVITGLDTVKDNYFTVFEYNGSGSSIDYLQAQGSVVEYGENSKIGVFCKNTNTSNFTGWGKLLNLTLIYNSYFSRNEIVLPKKNEIWTISQNQNLLHSKDDGRSWTYFNPGKEMNILYFIDSLTGYIGGDNGCLMKTINGGIAWTSSNINSNKRIYEIQFTSPNIGYLVTGGTDDTQGEIFKSTNGGGSWVKQFDCPKRLITLNFIDNNNGFAAGDATMLKTNNGGLTWSGIFTGVNHPINSLAFIDSLTGFATINYDAGKILKTGDGGNTWSIQQISNARLYIIKVINKNLIIASGYDELNKSYDGGVSWSNFPLFFDPGSIAFYGDNNIYAVDQSHNYNFYKSTSSAQTSFINSPQVSSNYCLPDQFVTNCIKIGTYNSGNIFTVQLSDRSGSFLTPIAIGQLSGTIGGQITCSLPLGIQAGNNYRIRIIASNPLTYGAVSEPFSVNYKPQSIISSSLDSIYYLNDTIVHLQNLGGPIGGIFKINGTNNNMLDPISLGNGNHIVQYIYSINGCSDTASKVVHIMEPNIVTLASINNTQYCAGTPLTINYSLQGSFDNETGFAVELSDAFGGFSNPISLYSNTDTVAGTLNCILPSSLQSGNHYKTRIKSTSPEKLSNNSIEFTVNAVQLASVDISVSDSIICKNQIAAFIASPTNGGINPAYQWQINGLPYGTNSPNFSTNNLHDGDLVSVSMHSAVNCAYPLNSASNPITMNVRDSVTPTIEIFTLQDGLCEGNPIDFIASPMNGGANPSYIWSVDGQSTGVVNSIFTTTLINDAIVSLHMNSSESCTYSNTATSQLYVNIDSIPKPTAIPTGPTYVCKGQQYTYYTSFIPNVINYIWTLPSGTIITTDTNFIIINFDNSAISGNLSVKGQNLCGEGQEAETYITVGTLPSNATTIIGSNSVCQGQHGSLYTTGIINNATSYNWTLPYGTIGVNNGDSIFIDFGLNALSGDISVAGVNSCGSGSTSSVAITVNPLPGPAGIISGVSTVCQGQPSVIYAIPSIPNANSYHWTFPSGVSGNGSSNVIFTSIGNQADSGFITVNGVNSCGDGQISNLFLIVNPVPSTPVVTFNFGLLHSSSPTGNQWYGPNGIIFGANDSVYLPLINGQYYTIVTLNGCASSISNKFNVVLTSLPIDVVQEDIQIYPNPANEKLFIQFPENNPLDYKIELYDAIGRTIIMRYVNSKNTNLISLDIEDFSRGMYILNIKSDKGFLVRKIIKN